MIKLLIGGSPCTYWSVAQKNNRETEPSGMGWELFKNYLIAKEKFKPDFFLYENNKSAAEPIKQKIREELNVWDGTFLMPDSGARYIEINSALVSAQNRQRFYVHNCGDVQQPKDRGILLRDILETGTDLSQNEKSYCLTATYGGATAFNALERSQRTMVAEPVCVQEQVFGRKADDDGLYDRRYEARTDGKSGSLTATNRQNAIAEPVRIPEYSTEKARPLTASYANKGAGEGSLTSECFPNNHNKQVFDYIAEPIRIGTIENDAKNTEEKPVLFMGEGKDKESMRRVYEVKDGKITIKDKQYPIKLKDGYYIIRKLTVTECCRLQTMPEVEHYLYINFNTGEICLDLQKINAQYAAEKCHKLQKFAKSVQEIELLEFVQFVENNTNIRLQQKSEPVLLSVHTNLEGLSNQKDYSRELLKNANIAGKNLRCLNQEQTEIFAQAIVGITTMLRKITQIGTVELRLKDKIFAVVKNGKMQFTLCGTEIMQLVKDADINMNKVKKSITSTILEVLPNLEICEQILTTLFCYVLNAIGGYILRKTNGEILLKIKTPYTYAVSASQGYKGLGNGWTAEVIIHILNSALKDVPKDEEIVVLSMYDGIGTGRYCLDKMGFTNVKYYAYEIDKYAKQIAKSNYPDIIECGDAFQVRNEDWGLK